MRPTFLIPFLAAILPLSAIAARAAEPAVRVVTDPSAAANTGLYSPNRAPLQPTAFMKLPAGSITPQGWLRQQLVLEANGMGGRLPEVSGWLKFEGNGWANPKASGGWEELPYWLKGYGDLGYVLHDPTIIAGARRWLDAILAGQQPDGFFGPIGLRTALDGKPDMWPHMPVLNALQSYYEFSQDARVIPFMTRYFQWQNTLPPEDFAAGYWPAVRFGDNLESIYWLYNRTGDAFLLDLARKMHQHMFNWSDGVHNWHNVNVAEGFREPTEFSLQQPDPALRTAAERNYDQVMSQYGQFPGGGFAGDENARPGYGDPRQGFETCGIVEYMHSFEMLTRMTGHPEWADRAEELAFNSLPAALTPTLNGLHYITAPNCIQLDPAAKGHDFDNGWGMLAYSPNAQYRCCQHNHTMGWPYYAEELWLATADRGLCASLYAASQVSAKVADGVPVTLTETTDYPFSDTVTLKLTSNRPVQFPLWLRVPRWTTGVGLRVNGQRVKASATPLSYLVVNRTWKSGDTVTLQLPMKVAVTHWKANKDAVSVSYGPLEFSLSIGEKWTRSGGTDAWPEWAVYPTTAWNYGLALNGTNPAAAFKVSHKPGPLPAQPFTPESSPIVITAPARQIPEWQPDRYNVVSMLQQSPARTTQPQAAVQLIPMGTARLRISTFPTVSTASTAVVWRAPVRPSATGFKASASHVFGGDSVDALSSGEEPRSSNDQGIPRFTWWDHRGTDEWVQYDFPTARRVSGISVYWFDDTGQGQCRVPASYRVLYKDGETWKPVDGAVGLGVDRDKFNRTTFNPITTTALRLEVQLQPNVSGGILQWKVE